MLGLSWTEMLVIGVVALIVIGPKDLPVVMNRIGKIVGQIRRMGSDFQRELNKTTGLDEVRNLRNSITEPLRKTSDEIRREFNTMTPNGPKPSGLIKPADPKAESVVDEIKAAAGIANDPVPAVEVTKPEPVKAAPGPTRPAVTTTAVTTPPGSAAEKPKVSRPRKKPVPALPTEPADLPAAPQRKSRTRIKPAESEPEVLPSEPADSPAAPMPKVRKPRKAAVTKPAEDATPVEDR